MGGKQLFAKRFLSATVSNLREGDIAQKGRLHAKTLLNLMPAGHRCWVDSSLSGIDELLETFARSGAGIKLQNLEGAIFANQCAFAPAPASLLCDLPGVWNFSIGKS